MKRLSLLAMLLVVVVTLFVMSTPRNIPPRSVQAAPTPSGVEPAYPPNFNFDEPGEGEVGTPPSNYDFETEPEEIGTPPSNYDFETGDFTGWTTSGTASVQSGGPTGYYASLGSGGTITSSAFTIPSDAQSLQVDMGTLGTGTNAYYIYILSGQNYSTQTTVKYYYCSSCAGQWTTVEIDPTTWRGQSVKLKVYRYVAGTIGVDNAGISMKILVDWDSQGLVSRAEYSQQYGDSARITTDITSSAFTVDDSAQIMSLQIALGDSAGNSFRILVLSGENYATETEVAYKSSSGAASWSEYKFGVGDWEGESIKVKVDRLGGTIWVDEAGIAEEIVAGWTPSGTGTFTLHDDPDIGSYIQFDPDSDLSIFSGLIHKGPATVWYTISYALPDFDKPPLDLGSAFRLWWHSGGNSWVVYQDGSYVSEPWKTVEFPVWDFTGDDGWFEWETILGIPQVGPVGGGQADGLIPDLDWDDFPTDGYEPPAPDAAAPCSAPEETADPVSVVTGAFRHQHTDLYVPGKGIPLQFTRYYNAHSSYRGALGFRWVHNYSMDVVTYSSNGAYVRYPSGRSVRFAYVSGNYVAPAGVFDTLVKNVDSTWTLTTKQKVRYNFDTSGKLASIVDRNDNTTSLTYTSGLLSSVTDPGGRSLTFTYDENDRIAEVTDPLDRTVEYDYDTNGDLVTVIDVRGGEATFTYSHHRLVTGTDPLDHTFVTNVYDKLSRVVQQTDAEDNVTTIDYDTPDNGATRMTNPRDNVTTFYFDSEYRTTDTENAEDNVAHWTYGTNNKPVCVTDRLGNKTAYDYDSSGNVTQIIDADNTDANCELKEGGEDWQYSYTANNDVDLAFDPLGRQTDWTYDQDGNVTQVVRKDDQGNAVARICFTRDGDGLITERTESTTLTDCTGNKTKFDYDDYGNQTEMVSPRFSQQQDPPVTTYTYDLGGRTLTTTNELDETTTYTYDEQNNPLTVEDALGNTSSSTFDAKGNLETITDANRQTLGDPETGAACGAAGTGDGDDDDSDTVVDDGCPTAIYVYDDSDRLIEVVDALGNSTTYGYDANGNRTSVTNANRQTVGDPEAGATCGAAGTGDGVDDDSDTIVDDGCPSMIYAYNDLDRLQSETDALGRTTSYEYDAGGNLIERTDARGLVTDYEYDLLNRRTLVEHWDGEALVDDVDYTYDAAGNRLSMTDETGTTEYEHDAMDRTTSVTFPGDSTVSYEYDEVGNRTKLTYPDTNEVDYTYDEAHDLETVTDWLDNVTTYAYDDAGQRIDTDLPNGVHTDHSYDGAGRLESVVNIGPGPTTISSFTYTRDAAGNRIEMEDLDGVHSYEYDPLDRLTEVTYPDQETDTYTYDAAANRLTKDTDDYTYNAASELTDVEGVTYDYDENGNEIARGNDAFEYDHENRLVESVIDSVTSSSTYNGDGLRMSHTVGQTTTDYIWDVASGLPVVLEDGTNTYVYGLDLISATDGQAAQVYFLADGLGSTTDLTDGNGDVVDSYTYDVFGATRSQAGSSDNYWLYTGEQRDDDSTFYYLRARYYDPSIGRFTAQDPLPGSVPQSQNLYTYVGCNPVSRSDPMGLRLIDEPGYGGDGGPLPPLPPNCWYVQVQSPPPPPPDTCQVSPNTPGCNPDWGIECPGGSLPGYYWLADRMDWVGDRVGDVGEWLSTRTPKCYILAGLYARTCGAAAVAACSTGGGIVVGGYVAGSYPCTALLASVLIACSEDR